MKNLIGIIIITILLSGCKPAAPDPRIAKLEARIACLEAQQNTDSIVASNGFDLACKSINIGLQNATNTSQLMDRFFVLWGAYSNLDLRVEKLSAPQTRSAVKTLDPSTGLPIGANPADYSKGRVDMTTGMPIRDDQK